MQKVKIEDIKNKILNGSQYAFSDWSDTKGKIIESLILPKNIKFKYNSKYGLSDWVGDIDVIFPEYHMKYNSLLKKSLCQNLVWFIKSTTGIVYKFDECVLIEI